MESVNTTNITNISEAAAFHKSIQSFWLGHSERCHHYTEKMLPLKNETGWLKGVIILFYHGLNSFKLLKKSNTNRNRKISKNAIAVLESAAEHSKWNYQNKVHLLEAERLSFEGRKQQAQNSYTAAIEASRASKFIHEHGLACELAAFHYEKCGDAGKAWEFFNQAKSCYTQWGSKMKVEFINRQLARFQVSLKSDS